ncbi:flagellar basal body L-ring protein FlgH [Buchnera aphidicola]|uniref:flagellar basal body L-ring protein FlgH n=1 Tax=Buchnera aphidicola TaxID=9 RepID=UPI003464B3A7
MSKLLLKFKYCLVAILLLMLNGCSSLSFNPEKEKKIMNTKLSNPGMKIKNNSLLKEIGPINNTYRPLFEDYKPQNIGDTITIILQENLSTSNKMYSNISRNGNSSIAVGIPSLADSFSSSNGNKSGLDTLAKNNFSGKGSASAQNSFLGVITVTINEILPNGNFKITGEKKISINKGKEFIRFSGILNPRVISKNNSAVSTQVADAHIEYISDTYAGTSNKMGWLQRFLFKISPM